MIHCKGKGGMKMKPAPFAILLLFMSLLLPACTKGVDPQEHLAEIYIAALDSMIKLDEALNHEMKYIAIDMSTFKDVDASAKEQIAVYFKEKYKVEVMDATFDQLKEKGLFNQDTLSLAGILLRIEEADFVSSKEVLFEGSKYKSGLGAIGVKSIVHFKDEQWGIKESKMTWIS
jgi:hypothetical protein